MVDHPVLGGHPHAEAQDLKEVTINESFDRYAHKPILVIQDKDLTSPPGSPAEGACYIVKATASGEWLGHDGEVAAYFSGWRFRTLHDGETFMLLDEGSTYLLSWWYNNKGSYYKMFQI